jgi:hypothetical protein
LVKRRRTWKRYSKASAVIINHWKGKSNGMIHKLHKASSRTYFCSKPDVEKYFTKVGQFNINLMEYWDNTKKIRRRDLLSMQYYKCLDMGHYSNVIKNLKMELMTLLIEKSIIRKRTKHKYI